MSESKKAPPPPPIPSKEEPELAQAPEIPAKVPEIAAPSDAKPQSENAEIPAPQIKADLGKPDTSKS